jgi:hypothetical protein
MPVLAKDIRNRIGAGRYYSLAIEPLKDWEALDSYVVDDVVNSSNSNYSGYETITTAYRALTDNTDSNPAENSIDWEEYSLAVEGILTRTVRFIKAFCKNRNHTFAEDEEEETEAVILLSIAYLIDYSNQMSNADAEDSASIDEKKSAMEYLDNAFQLKDSESSTQAPYAYISNTNATVRTLGQTDPNSYYNKDYSSRDLDK